MGNKHYSRCIDKRHTLRYYSIVTKVFEWNEEKNQKLIRERGISFEAIVSRVEEEDILAIISGKGRYKNQKQYIVAVSGYAYVVPFVEETGKIFLKTIIPSRRMTKQYLTGGISDEEISSG